MSNINSNEVRLISTTNSRLTTNVKVVVEDSEKFWLNSIPQFVELDDRAFQKIPLYDGTAYGTSLSRFWKNKELPKDSMYETNDATLLSAGCNLNTNFYYSQRFKYFAPLWLSDSYSPDYFIIFKIEDFDYTDTITDYYEFYKTYLYTSPIVATYALKEKRLGDFIIALDPSAASYSITTDDKLAILSGYKLSSGINMDLGAALMNKYDVDDTQIIRMFSENEMVSNKLYNFEFLFDDAENLESSTASYFGAYFTKEEICTMELDIDKHNVDLDNKVRDLYTNPNAPNLEITSDTDIELHIKSFSIDLSELFYYECLTEGNDYGFWYSPYCGYDYDTEIQYGADGGYYDTLVPDPTFVDWVDSYGYDIDYWLYCDYDYNYLENANGLFFYAIENRVKDIFNITEFGPDMTVASKKLYLDGFYGTDPDTALTIPGKVLTTKSYNHIKLEVQRSSDLPVFSNGDWIQMRVGYRTNQFIWRVIFDTGNCCNATDYCYKDSPSLRDITCDLTFVRNHNSIFLTMKMDKYIKIEEGQPIKLSCDEFRNAPFVVSKVDYNYTDDTTSLTIVDFLGYYFRSCNSVRSMEIEYEGPSYHYTFVNPSGTIRDVNKKIVEAFNSFPNRLFEGIEYDDTIILKSKETGDLFSNFYFDYDFTKSSTPTKNIIINNQEAAGTPIFDSHLYEFWRRRRYLGIPFYGGNDFDTGVRFYVDSDWLTANMTGEELIPTQFTKSPLRKYSVERVETFYSNYLDEPQYFGENLISYKNMNEYAVLDLDLEKPNNSIRVSARDVIDATYPYNPKLLKMLIFKQEKI